MTKETGGNSDCYSDEEIQIICEKEATIFNYFPEPDLLDMIENKNLPF